MKTKMKRKYEDPQIEVLEISVEAGFAGSTGGTAESVNHETNYDDESEFSQFS